MGNSDSKVREDHGRGQVEGVQDEFTHSKDDMDFPAESRDDGNTSGPQFISDDQVQVNLPVVDLMAYLQVVANNSSRLPRSRRDGADVNECDDMSPDLYAQKSAAFIPADIRVIGAMPNGYVRTDDLPTVSDYHIGSQATEPGRSYGGACTNAMLKVLYDAASEQERLNTRNERTSALFDDEEEEDEVEEDSSIWMGRSFRSNNSLEQEASNSRTLSFGDLLRRMKAEMLGVEYSQIPKFTSSRRINLNEAFTLLPTSFDHRKNKKRSLLIGCNYHISTSGNLKASHDDVRSMKDYIVNVHGFPETKDYMTILLDDGSHLPPTFINIVEAFKKLSEESAEGDSVFIHFSGHGGRVLSSESEQMEAIYDEVLVPCDYETSGFIRDTLIFKTLLAPLKYGVTCTFLVDACNQGMMVELPYAWNTKVEKSVACVNPNEDFSFLRSLKVVKTLYETSAFTRVGKGIGSALGPTASPPSPEKIMRAQPPQQREADSIAFVPSSAAESTPSVGGFSSAPLLAQSPRGSIFDSITTACASKQHDDVEEVVEILSDGSKCTAISERKEANSFFDVMRCSLIPENEDEIFSDEDDTFHTDQSRTYFGWEEEQVSSLESFEYVPRSRRG